jgi:hypothetical protein
MAVDEMATRVQRGTMQPRKADITLRYCSACGCYHDGECPPHDETALALTALEEDEKAR